MFYISVVGYFTTHRNLDFCESNVIESKGDVLGVFADEKLDS